MLRFPELGKITAVFFRSIYNVEIYKNSMQPKALNSITGVIQLGDIMETIPAKITPRLSEEMDDIIRQGWYANRSEFIRDAIRDKIKETKLQMLEAAIKEDVEWGLHGKY